MFGKWNQNKLQRQEKRTQFYDLINEKLEKLGLSFKGSNFENLAQSAQTKFKEFMSKRQEWLKQKENWIATKGQLDPEERMKKKQERMEAREGWQKQSRAMLVSVAADLETLKNKQPNELVEDLLKLMNLVIKPKPIENPVI